MALGDSFPVITPSTYGHPLGTYLHQQGHVVSIVNPARIKGKIRCKWWGLLMHKLIRVVYGVLKSGQPFDPDKLLPFTSEPMPDLALAQG